MANALREKLLKNSTISFTSGLEDSTMFGDRDLIPTAVPMINVALSGRIDGGISSGTTMFAGPSKHFKTGFALLMAASFLAKYPDGTILFYDSEFGTPQGYFESFGIPLENVVHTPVTDLEELRHDIVVQLANINRNDRVFVVIDSIGNLASRKEVEDALSGKDVADMTRAKTIKSLFRIIGPKLTLKNIALIAINHTYKEIGMFPKDVVSGGTGSYYNADNIWILGRQQDKETQTGPEIRGYKYVINVEKSRYVREKSKIIVDISFDGGINKWSGLFDLALEAGYLSSEKKGWYNVVNLDTGELGTGKRRSDIENDGDFWKALFAETEFPAWISNKYMLSSGNILEGNEKQEEE